MTSAPVRRQRRGLTLPYGGRPRPTTAGPQILLRGVGFGFGSVYDILCQDEGQQVGSSLRPDAPSGFRSRVRG